MKLLCYRALGLRFAHSADHACVLSPYTDQRDVVLLALLRSRPTFVTLVTRHAKECKVSISNVISILLGDVRLALGFA